METQRSTKETTYPKACMHGETKTGTKETAPLKDESVTSKQEPTNFNQL